MNEIIYMEYLGFSMILRWKCGSVYVRLKLTYIATEISNYSKTCLKRPQKEDQKWFSRLIIA